MFDKLQLMTGVAGGQNPLRPSRQKRRCHPRSSCFLTLVPHLLSAFDFYLLQSSSLCSVFPLHLHSVPAAFLFPWTTTEGLLMGFRDTRMIFIFLLATRWIRPSAYAFSCWNSFRVSHLFMWMEPLTLATHIPLVEFIPRLSTCSMVYLTSFFNTNLERELYSIVFIHELYII